MACDILVVTPDAAFGTLIRQSLEESGEYHVQACQSSVEALVLCRLTSFTIAILDSNLADQPLAALGQDIQAYCPGVHLAVFAEETDSRSTVVNGSAFQAYLKKPLYLPSLQKAIDSLQMLPAQPVVKDLPATAPRQAQKKETIQDATPESETSSSQDSHSEQQIPPGTSTGDPPEPGPTINLSDLEQVRSSWVREVVETHPEDTRAIFTCVLTPLVLNHYLRLDQMNALKKWMQQISDENAWQLVRLSIRPSHMEWTVCIPASTSPKDMINNYRQDTSNHLYAQFPSLEEDNPSGDFWAPGYLLNSGGNSLSRQQISTFIASTHPTSIPPYLFTFRP
jgi:REP element-mobilizing transposase RayT/CheY-like chemotaxis protein